MFKKLWLWIKKTFEYFFKSNYWGWFNLAIVTILASLLFRLFPQVITWDIIWNGMGIVFGFSLFLEMSKFVLFVGMLGKRIEDVYGSRKQQWQQIIGNVLLAQIGFLIALV